MRRTSMDFGKANVLSMVAAQGTGNPSSGPRGTSVGIDRTVLVTGATRTVRRTSIA